MNATAKVRLTDNYVPATCSTLGTVPLSEDHGANETAYRVPHAPRPAWSVNAALLTQHVDISASQLPIRTTQRWPISDRACPNARLLAPLRPGCRHRKEYSRVDLFDEIRVTSCRPACTRYLRHCLTASSIFARGMRKTAPYRGPNSAQLRSKRSADSREPKSIKRLIVEVTHPIAGARLGPAPSTTHLPERLARRAYHPTG
jgi:hypothetical protein